MMKLHNEELFRQILSENKIAEYKMGDARLARRTYKFDFSLIIRRNLVT